MEDQVHDFIRLFASIFLEAMPFIVLGSVIAGFLEHFIPARWFTKIIPGNRPAAIALGCLLGLALPMCECGIVPIMRRLLRKGVPLSCCVAYMMCGPVINLIVLSSTLVAFAKYTGGWQMTALRGGLAFLVGFVTASIIDRMHRKHGNELLLPLARPGVGPDPDAEEMKGSFLTKIGRVAETGMHDFIDITVFLTIGAVLSALCNVLVSKDTVEELGNRSPALSVLAFMGLAIILCLCSEADAFVAASFSNLPPAPKLAFLVLGPMLDLKLYFLFTRVFGRRVIWTIVTSVIVQVFVYSMVVHYLMDPSIGSVLPPSAGD